MRNSLCKSEEDEDEQLKLVGEQSFEMLEAVEESLEDIFGGAGIASLNRMKGYAGCLSSLSVDLLEHLDGEDRWCLLVELCDLVEDIDGFLLLASTEEELGRLVELEDKVAEEEDGKGHGAENNDQVSPPHIAADGAACDTIGDRVACW